MKALLVRSIVSLIINGRINQNVPVHRFNGSRLKGSVGLDLSLFAYIPRIRRRIGRHKPNTRKLIKPIFAFSRNILYRLCHTVFAAAEPARHPAGGADNNLQTCTQTTRNVEPFSTVNGYIKAKPLLGKLCPFL